MKILRASRALASKYVNEGVIMYSTRTASFGFTKMEGCTEGRRSYWHSKFRQELLNEGKDESNAILNDISSKMTYSRSPRSFQTNGK